MLHLARLPAVGGHLAPGAPLQLGGGAGGGGGGSAGGGGGASQ